MRHPTRPLGPDETVEIIRRKILGELPIKAFADAAVPPDPVVTHDICELPLAAPAGEERVFLMFTPGGCTFLRR